MYNNRIASDVTHVRVGDEVFASNWGQGRHDDVISNPIVGGAFSEFILIPAHKLSLKPPGITHAQVNRFEFYRFVSIYII